MVGVAEGMRVWGGGCWRVGVPTFSLNLGVSSLYTFFTWEYSRLFYSSITFYSLLLPYVPEHSTSFCNLPSCSIRFYHFPRCSVGFHGIPWDSGMFYNLPYASITFHWVPNLFLWIWSFTISLLSYLILSYLISLIFHSLPGSGDWIL